MAKKTSNLKYYEGVGRRKSAVSRARLFLPPEKTETEVDGIKLKKGEIIVNGKPINSYFSGAISQIKYKLPFEQTGTLDRFAVSIHVDGGGKSGQLGAVIHAVSRALQLVDKDFRPPLKAQGLLTRDPRVRERRKVGMGGKARRKKQSPKR